MLRVKWFKWGWDISGVKTEKYGKWYVLILFITGMVISFSIYKLMGKTEQNAYMSEVKIEASSLAMSLDLIMANHAIKIQNFEDHIDVKKMDSAVNRQVIQAAFDHSIFSSFSFLKYKGLDAKSGEVMAQRLLRVVAKDKPVTPVFPTNPNHDVYYVQAPLTKSTIQQMLLKNEKQNQFFLDINGEAVYVIISRSVDNDKIFYTFGGFARNLFNDNFPSKTNIEGVIHQIADNSYWHVVKKNTTTTFKKISESQMELLLSKRIIFQYLPRFGSGKYFNFQVLVPSTAPQKNLFSIIVFISGVVITLLLCFLLHYLISRNILINNIVKERTFELEEESKKSKEAAIAKSRFLANISHEIRTPLNIVLGMTDLLSETSMTSLQKHYLNSINNSGRHLLQLINDILDMTRVDLSEVVFKPQMVSLLQVLEESCLAVDELARNKNLDLYMDLDPTLPYLIEIDPSRVRQVLINILSNSVKYTEKGFIEFSAVGKWNRESGEYYLEFRIKDSGIGISDKDKEEIFKAFYQVNTSIKRSQGGVGLGLSIVASIVKRLNGKVDVQSTPGIGSTFTVQLPIQKYSPETWSSQMALTTSSAMVSNSENIFISNDTILTGIFTKYMKSMKHQIHTFHDVQKMPVSDVVYNCVFVDMDTVSGFTKKKLGGLKYNKLVCIGEPSENPATFSKKLMDSVFLWPNKLLLPSSIAAAVQFVPSPVDAQDAQPSVAVSEKNEENLNILIVDDDISNKMLFQAYCASKKWNVNFASNGQEALDNYLRQKHYDILITDLQMPVMDGFTLIQHLRDENTFTPDYTIVLSADSTEETINMSKTMAVDAFLAKPIRKAEFLNAIQKASREV